jgi:hypothetical protein
MAIFRIYLPLYLLRSEQERPELITVSEVSAQACFNPLLLPKCLRLWWNPNPEAFVRRPLNHPLPGWLRPGNKAGSINQAVCLQGNNDLIHRRTHFSVDYRSA